MFDDLPALEAEHVHHGEPGLGRELDVHVYGDEIAFGDHPLDRRVEAGRRRQPLDQGNCVFPAVSGCRIVLDVFVRDVALERFTRADARSDGTPEP